MLAAKAARQEQWTAGHPPLPDLAERCQQFTDEIERLRALFSQHGVDPQDKGVHPRRAAMSPAASGGRSVEPVTEEDF
jgi:hypothetical protein